MATCSIVGLQWGDEGKGKLVSSFSPHFDYVVRYQGGCNAGHTIYVNGKKIVLHHIPSGIVAANTTCLLMPGMVLHPPTFEAEISALQKLGIETQTRLKISGRIHIITEYHRQLDQLRENFAGKKKIGTTGRGIGAAYADKAERLGIRAIDLQEPDLLRSKLEHSLALKNPLLKELGGKECDLDGIFEELLLQAKLLKPYMLDTTNELLEALNTGRSVLFEGAQAAMLDLDLGTYPYVTSSPTSAAGIACGCGVASAQPENIIGVAKAYCTRVGGGPFPTEIDGDVADYLREQGGEFGSTTGRPRRCGWLDAFALKKMAELGSVNALCLTKIDILRGLKEIKIATGYKNWSGTSLPESTTTFGNLEPIYQTFPGFEEDISHCKSFSQLPAHAQKLIIEIEKFIGIPVKYISTGPHDQDLIER